MDLIHRAPRSILFPMIQTGRQLSVRERDCSLCKRASVREFGGGLIFGPLLVSLIHFIAAARSRIWTTKSP